MKSIFRMFSAALLLFLSIDAHAANGQKLVMEEFMVPAVDPGISLYVRNKHPQGVNTFPSDKILLYVHGATYPSETAFDLQLNGHLLYEKGAPVPFDAKTVSQSIRSNRETDLVLTFREGSESIRFWTSDLNADYVRFNADYST